MKKNLFLIALFAGMLAWSCSSNRQAGPADAEILEEAASRLERSLQYLNDTSLNPRNMEDGEIGLVPPRDWTSGFFPGILWMMYDYTGDSVWLAPAHHFTMNVVEQQYNGGTHDLGFMMYCSFGNGYRLTGSPIYREVLVQSARTLATRFNPAVGCIRSWDFNGDKWEFPVIIDNMMNLELLFWATEETGDSTFYDIAVRHAETTLKNHFRDDNSSYHVISYDTITGEVMKRNTHQGYSDESAWARGQAWALYGFTMTYRETGDERFLDQADAIAEFILEHPHLPADKVPYWDFDAPGRPDTYRDVSAAAITASALYELSGYRPEKEVEYLEAADQILHALSTTYALDTEKPVPFLLDHSVGHLPGDSEVDVPIIYADYYYLEALLRRM